MQIKNPVTQVPAAVPEAALAYFERRLWFETDCWDVHSAIHSGNPDFVLLDVRSKADFERQHVPGALHLPHDQINSKTVNHWSPDTLFVVYCAGPHCNGANKAAIQFARLGRPVKEMIGGVSGWREGGYSFEGSTHVVGGGA